MFCAVECRQDAYQHGRPRYEPKPCATCGKEFTPKTNFTTCCSHICYAAKWNKVNPERVARRDEQQKRKYAEDPKYRKRILGKEKRKYAEDPEYRKRRLEHNKRKYAENPEHRKKRFEQAKRRYADDPEYRKKILERKKRKYADDPEHKKNVLEQKKNKGTPRIQNSGAKHLNVQDGITPEPRN